MNLRILGLLVVAACGGSSVGGSTDVEPTLVFADLDDLTISRLVTAASMADGFGAQAVLSQFDESFDNDPCPIVTEDPATLEVTVTGGCTTLDDHRIEGSGTIQNPLGWGELDYDFGSDSIYTFDNFEITFDEASGIKQSWDGVFSAAPAFAVLDLDLTLDAQQLVVRSDLYMECSQTECEHGESGIELVGSGGARVSGTVSVSGQTATTTLTLRGEDTVHVTNTGTCIHWEIEETGRVFDQGTCP